MRISNVITLWAGLVFLILCITSALGESYCKEDKDCKHFGELICLKDKCETGICSCKPRTAARFYGDLGKFKCVPVKKIGESCSPDGRKGLCGAPNSVCNGNNKCECKAGKTPGNGMEICLDQDKREPGEYCVAPDQTCTSKAGINEFIGKVTPSHIPCKKAQQLILTNLFSENKFLSSTYPLCADNVIGSRCEEDVECKSIKQRNAAGNDENGGVCDTTTKKCKCKTPGLVPDSDGTHCGEPLGFGDECSNAVGTPINDPTSKKRKVCDAGKGLTCGDPCIGLNAVTDPKKCECAATHIKSGTTCTPRKDGDACFGDSNCKGISPTAVCVDKKCKAVSPFQTDGSGVAGIRPQLVIITLGTLIAVKTTLM